MKHIADNAEEGTTMSELQQVLPAMSRYAIQWMLRDLRKEGKIRVKGRTKAARWYPTSMKKHGHDRS